MGQYMLKLKYYYHEDFIKLNDEILNIELTEEDTKKCKNAVSNHYYINDIHKIQNQKYLLTRSGEYKLFLKYNYCKYKLSNLPDITKDEREYKEAINTRNIIIENNMRACLMHTNKYAVGNYYDEYLSESFNTLLAAIDAFNFTFGYAFSTYLWPSISNKLKNISRKRNAHVLESLPFDVFDNHTDSEYDYTDNDKLNKLLNTLTDREKDIIISYYCNGITYKDIGVKYNLSRERIRQISDSVIKELNDKWEIEL